MKTPLLKNLPFTVIAASFAVTAFAQETVVIHDWQFNDAAGTAVFNDALNTGVQAGADTENWLETTTDGEGNWHVTGTSENRFSGYWLHESQQPVSADKLILEWAYSSWDWSAVTQNPNIGFGFYSPGDGTNGSVTILRNGTSIRTRDSISKDVVNFLSNTISSADIPEPRVPIDQATKIEFEGAPALGAGDSLKFRYTVDFTAEPDTYIIDYGVNESEYYTIYTGEWPYGDIDQIRMQAANPEVGNSVKIDYMVVTGENVVFPELASSPWADVYPLIGDIVRDTGIGWIDDSQYPYVYHFNADTWLYIDSDSATLESIYGYNFAYGFWFWTADDIDGWHFNLEDPEYGQSGWAPWY
ncbi:hypothetical protein G0Q06_12160 [Puniceicoccales bacterium CK1056]|uniref:Uncharacterized protein n=1 Tax=Oceanipulchritudo coccoides TaxID=2706888 RepID=A0A6B2M6B9_9BACT|nr:hypothetical protein [Oceanipulchritudo coccoides]NDV63210.1 hypothetical protein [Oceanipulchritudo coccoides]